MTDEPDDLEAILTSVAMNPSLGLHDTILLRMERELYRRRTMQRLAKVGTIAAVLGLGFLIGQGTRSEPSPRGDGDMRVRKELVIPIVILVPVPAEEPSSPSPIARIEPETAAQAELLAEQSDDRGEAARLYRLAGDRYLNDAQDYLNAARCYRLHLARTGDSGLTPAAADTWLLTSLKNSLFKEKLNVAKTDG